jgi:hypothetical protein
MGFANSGVLQVGADADLILIDLDRPHLVPRHNLAAKTMYDLLSAEADELLPFPDLGLSDADWAALAGIVAAWWAALMPGA